MPTETDGEGAQDLVAAVVADDVVDDFEVVDVDDEAGDGGVLESRFLERGGEALFEHAAVGEVGERVAHGEPLGAQDVVFEQG